MLIKKELLNKKKNHHQNLTATFVPEKGVHLRYTLLLTLNCGQ